VSKKSGSLPTTDCSNYLTPSAEAADGISLAGMIRRFPALEWDCLPNQPSVLVEMATEFIQLADYPEF